VTSVALSAPTSDFIVSGSPVTHSGTLNLAWKIAPTSAATPNAIVKRDASGNFASAGVTAGASSFVANNTTQVVSVVQNGSGAALSAFSAVDNGIVGQTTGAGRQSGVLGIAGTAASFSIGVQGQAQSTNGTGMLGLSTGSSGIGVSGRSTGSSGIGVAAAATATSGATQALFARVFSPSGIAGVFDNAGAGQILSLRNKGVENVAVQNNGIVQIGTTDNSGMLDVTAASSSLAGLSVSGWTSAVTDLVNGTDAIHAHGGNAEMGGPAGAGISSSGGGGGEGTEGGPGIVAAGGGPGTGGGTGGIFVGAGGKDADGDGVYAVPGSNVPSGYAGNFQGDINVTGAVFAGTKDFRIDHPLDPANKYLVHASVESSEMKNIYDGIAVLDANGQADITLPKWFEAVNGDFRYQLTAIGRPSPSLYIAQEIADSRFQIGGGTPGTKVSWQVTGVRKDAYAKAYPLVVEQEKRPRERGYYIHPELYGAPQERSMEWGRHPRWMKQIREMRAKQAANFRDRRQRSSANR
jgi:trimeric autotransporter adhesin